MMGKSGNMNPSAWPFVWSDAHCERRRMGTEDSHHGPREESHEVNDSMGWKTPPSAGAGAADGRLAGCGCVLAQHS